MKLPLSRLPVWASTKNALIFGLITAVVIASPSYVRAEELAPPVEQPAANQLAPQPEAPAVLPAPIAEPAAPDTPPDSSYRLNAVTGLWENNASVWDPATRLTTPKTSTVILPTADPAPTPAQPQAAAADSAAQQTVDATVTNNIAADATSGHAAVLDNTIAGDAISGTATTIASLITLLQTSWNGSENGQVVTYLQNIFGDINHDITVDPGAAAAGGQPSLLAQLASLVSGTIRNNVDLSARSGDATVSDNGTAGDATTGDASAIATLVNVINSHINAGGSFFGLINIFGNLNGDLLLPGELQDQLHSGDATGGSGVATSGEATMNATINNVVNADARSGDTTVSDNGRAGDATTGSARTNVAIFNLTGHQIVSSNAFLVFVNVLGNWMGLILDAPAGATSATLTDGSDTTGPQADSYQQTTDARIDNTVRVAAQSGDATVSDNGRAGNATSGNATAAVSIVNIAGSSINLARWFGIMVINVFGSWNGSFGVDTASGGYSTSQLGSGGGSTEGLAATTSGAESPSAGDTTRQISRLFGLGSGEPRNDEPTPQEVLGAVETVVYRSAAAIPAKVNNIHPSIIYLLIGLFLALLAFAAERYVAYRHEGVLAS